MPENEKDLEDKDVAYSPASETETAAKQDGASHTDVETDDVTTLPGTGGPDDTGDIEADPGEFNLNGREFPGHASDQ